MKPVVQSKKGVRLLALATAVGALSAAVSGCVPLVLGGAAAVATKKGLWGIIGGFLAATWKFLIAGAVALFAGVGKLFGRKKSAE
mgnify:CR=1 FL=1